MTFPPRRPRPKKGPAHNYLLGIAASPVHRPLLVLAKLLGDAFVQFGGGGRIGTSPLAGDPAGKRCRAEQVTEGIGGQRPDSLTVLHPIMQGA